MARPTTLRGSKLLLLLGDGGTPEVFFAPCALATKGFERSAESNDFSVPDCDDPDAPIWKERVKSALEATITGSGTLAQEALDAYEAFWLDPDPRNMQVVIDYNVGPRTYQGPYIMSQFNITGEQDGLIQVELEFQSAGEIAVVA